MGTTEVVQAYHSARFRGDVPGAAAQLADEFMFSSPLIQSRSPDGHLGTLDAFLQIVTGVDMISELYGDDEATLVYDVHTATPVGTQRTAEHFRLTGGRISEIKLIFDATLWRQLLP
jgi:hypothetical protein